MWPRNVAWGMRPRNVAWGMRPGNVAWGTRPRNVAWGMRHGNEAMFGLGCISVYRQQTDMHACFIAKHKSYITTPQTHTLHSNVLPNIRTIFLSPALQRSCQAEKHLLTRILPRCRAAVCSPSLSTVHEPACSLQAASSLATLAASEVHVGDTEIQQ